MEFCARQQLLNLPPPPPTMTNKRRRARPAPAPSSARAAWPRSRQPAAGLLCWSPRPRPSRLALQVAARPSQVISLNNIIQDTKLPREGKFFELEMTVRDSDLDIYGVVNNAVYAGYIETGRQKMLASLGVCTGSIVRSGRCLAISELTIKYFAPLKRDAKFIVMVRVVQIKGVRMLMEHLIAALPDRKLVLEAMATVVCLNKDYRPTRMFPEMAKLLHFFSHPN